VESLLTAVSAESGTVDRRARIRPVSVRRAHQGERVREGEREGWTGVRRIGLGGVRLSFIGGCDVAGDVVG
jgi:hypothetical protein